jgi:hypothetical protein
VDAIKRVDYLIAEANLPHWKHIVEIEEILINPAKYQDPVFISIDTEGGPALEIGISIIDTRHLRRTFSSSETREKAGSLISTFN